MVDKVAEFAGTVGIGMLRMGDTYDGCVTITTPLDMSERQVLLQALAPMAAKLRENETGCDCDFCVAAKRLGDGIEALIERERALISGISVRN